MSEGVPDMACGRQTCPVEVADSPRAAAGWSEMGLQLHQIIIKEQISPNRQNQYSVLISTSSKSIILE